MKRYYWGWLACTIMAAGCSASAPSTRAPLPPTWQFEAPPDGGEKTQVGDRLQDHVEYALRHKPELRQSYLAWKAAEKRAEAVDRYPEPMISYGYYVSSVETRVGPQRHKAGLRQKVLWPGKIDAKRSAAEAAALGRREAISPKMLKIRERVAHEFWSIWRLKRERHWQEQQVALVDSLIASLRARLEIGRAQLADLNQVELKLGRLRDGISGLDEQRAQSEARLLGAIGAPDSVRAAVGDAPPALGKSAISETEALARLQRHPEIASIQARRTAALQEAASRDLAGNPDFTFGVDWIETGDSAMNPAPPDSGKDAIIISGALSLPVWQDDYDSATEAASIRAEMIGAEAEARLRILVVKYRQADSKLRDARRRIQLHESTLLPQAEAAYSSRRVAYEAGRSDVAAVLMSLEALLALRVQLVRLHAQAAMSQASLDYLLDAPTDKTAPKAEGSTQ